MVSQPLERLDASCCSKRLPNRLSMLTLESLGHLTPVYLCCMLNVVYRPFGTIVANEVFSSGVILSEYVCFHFVSLRGAEA
jgi:hypothetical protein